MVRGRRRGWIVALLVGVAAVSGCGGDDGSTDPAALKDRLPSPATFPGFTLERTLTWDNPIDLVAGAIPLPQSTQLSVAVKALEDAGFEAGAGQELFKGEHEARLAVKAMKFDSDDGAREGLDYVEKEGLKQPCLGACSEVGSKFAVPDIPGARGVQQLPVRNPPRGAPPPFYAYGVGFTVGPYLYLVNGEGDPGAIKKGQVVAAARALYRRAAEGT
jgi:hypothetical protein